MTHGSWIHPYICLFGLNSFVCLSIICRNEMSLFVPNMVSEILQLWRTWQWKIMRINGGSFESHLVFILLKGTTSIDHHRALYPTTSNHHHQLIIDHHGAQPLAPTTISTTKHYHQPPLSPPTKTNKEHHRKCEKAAILVGYLKCEWRRIFSAVWSIKKPPVTRTVRFMSRSLFGVKYSNIHVLGLPTCACEQLCLH